MLVNIASCLFLKHFLVYRIKFKNCCNKMLFGLPFLSSIFLLAMFKIKITDSYVILFHGVINTNARIIMFLKLLLMFLKYIFF